MNQQIKKKLLKVNQKKINKYKKDKKNIKSKLKKIIIKSKLKKAIDAKAKRLKNNYQN